MGELTERDAVTRVLIFGAGQGGIRLWAAIAPHCGVEVVAFLDNDPGKQGTTLLGVPIRGLEWVDDTEYDLVLVASVHHPVICDQLARHGVDRDRIVVLNSGDDLQTRLRQAGVSLVEEFAPMSPSCTEVRRDGDAARAGLERQITRLRARLDEAERTESELRQTIAALSERPTADVARTDPFEWLLHAHVAPPARPIFISDAVRGRVSVIIPVFNAARFLQETVRSVWAQSLDADRIEIVLADDGSTDGSLEMARTLRDMSPMRMEVLTHPGGGNLGVSATRNLALSHATGEFVALLDADDVFLPERLARGLAYMAATPACEAVCSLGDNIDEHGAIGVGANGTTVAGEFRATARPLEPPFSFDQLWETYPVANSSLLIRRAALARAGGYRAEMAHQAEDFLLVLKLSLASPIHCLEERLIRYRHHGDSYTTQYHMHVFEPGMRLELLYYLVHWMVVERPEYRARGLRLFRRHYPLLLSRSHAGRRAVDTLISMASTEAGMNAQSFLAARERELAELGALRDLVPDTICRLRAATREIARLRGDLAAARAATAAHMPA